MKTIAKIAATVSAAAFLAGLTGCADMTGGSTTGTLGGAAVGGVIGNQTGK